jgi:hypothetical protein
MMQRKLSVKPFSRRSRRGSKMKKGPQIFCGDSCDSECSCAVISMSTVEEVVLFCWFLVCAVSMRTLKLYLYCYNLIILVSVTFSVPTPITRCLCSKPNAPNTVSSNWPSACVPLVETQCLQCLFLLPWCLTMEIVNSHHKFQKSRGIPPIN